MNMSSPKYYGSTKQKNKEEKIGGRTIIDFHSCLDVAFVCLWLFSICARPTIVSTIHLLLFGIYVIIGGIILYETTKKNKTCLINQQSPKYSKKKKKKKKKKHKVELTDLSESLISHTPPTYVDNKYMSLTSNKQISSFHDQNISHPPVRYGVDSMIMIMLSIYCTLVALIQVIIQILISANIINGNNNALNMFGFQEPKETHEWLLYLTLDLILCVITIGLAYLHKRRNDKYKWSRLNIINVEKILLSTRKSLPILESYHSKLSDILSDDDDDDDNDDYDIDIDSVASTNKSMLITGSQKQATLPIFYTFTTSCLLLLISIAAPSVLHIPYFLVVLLVCLGPIIALWKQTKSVFHMIGPIYMLLHLILISLYQVEVIQNVLNDTISDILGLENLHQSYWSYQDFIHNQHIVPNLVSTVFMVILFYCLGLRPILLHSSIYRATPSQTSIRQKSHSHSHSHSLLKKSSGGNLFLSPPPHRKRAISNKNNKSSKKSGSYQALPDIESDISSDLTSDSKDNVEKTRIKKFLPHKQEGEKEEKKHDSHPLEIINESATKIISDRRSTIMCTIFYRLSAQEDMKEEEEEDSNKNKNKNKKLSKDRPRAFSRIQPVITTKKTSRSKRAKTVSFIKGRTLDSDTDSDDETMIKIERQESLRRLRSEQLTRKKLSMASIKSSIRSIQPVDDDDDDDDNDDSNIFIRKIKIAFHWIECMVELMSEWLKWRFFLWGPLFCQIVCLWTCFPHHDSFFIIIMMWSYLSLFLLSSIFTTRHIFDQCVIFILIYSMCAAFIKYVSYIPSLYDSNSSKWFAYFGMKDYGDMNGSYLFFACVPFLITAGYMEMIHDKETYRLINCKEIISYIETEKKSKQKRRKNMREIKKIAGKYPRNFQSILSKRGGTILHTCVDKRNAEIIPIIAPFIDVNARDMYGRTALSQARLIHRCSTNKQEIDEMNDIIAALWRVGCKRNKQMKWYSKFWQYLVMTGNYLAAAFYVMIEKIILFGVYVISTERADILHLIFLLYFLMFLVLGPLAHRYWWTLVLYNGIAVTLRYIFNVFDIQLSHIVANEFGLRPPNNMTGLIYPAILLSFVILHYHLTKQRKERHTLLEFKFEQLILKNAARRTNSLLFAILYYLFYVIQDWCLLFVYIALLMIGMIQIHSINLGYCVCVFLCFFFHCWFKDPWKKIRAYWILIVAYCALCFFGLYASQYSFIHDWVQDDLYPKSFNDKYFSLQDIGLTNEDTNNEQPFAMFMILLGPVIAMILTVIQFSFFVTNKPHQEVKSNYYITKLSKICCQILYLGAIHCEKITLLSTFLWCVYRVNLISMTYVVIICVALINRITLKTCWCPFQIIAVIVFILKYCYQFHYFEDQGQVTNAQVIGFERFGVSNGAEPVDASTAKIWNGLGQELTIIILATIQCILQWWVQMKPKYASIDDQRPVIVWKKPRIYYEDLQNSQSQEKSYTYTYKDDNNNNNNQIYDPLISIQQDNFEYEYSESELESSVSKLSRRSMSQAALLSALRFTRLTWTIVWRCLWRTWRRFWHILTNIFYFYGVELSVIMMVFAAFYRVYSFSWIYLFVTVCYIYDSRMNGINYKEWVILRKIWWLLWILLTVWLMFQYWIVIPYEIQHIIGECCGSKWWKLFHFDYNFKASECRQWWSWLALIDYRATDLIFDFFVLLFVSLQRTNFIKHEKIKKNNKIKKQLTLTKYMKQKTEWDENADILWESIKLQCLIYSDKILLLLMFVFGIMNVDLLSIVFLLFPFFELFFSDSTNKQQLIQWWNGVQIYNYFVLALFTLYQLPAIPSEKLKNPFTAWQDIVGVYKIYSNGNYYCYDEPCTNIFSNSSIIHNIILLIIIDLQIKILKSKSYENGVIATYKEWKLFSQYRCFHSALMMKFKRLAQIDFFQKEKQIVQKELEDLFSDEKLHDKLAFGDEELTFYPRLEGELANKAQQEEELYKKSIKGHYDLSDPNLEPLREPLNPDKISPIDFMDLESSSSSSSSLIQYEEKKKDISIEEEEEEESKKEEKLFVPYEEGLFMLIDKDFYVINTLAPKERYCKIMDFFDGGNELPWHKYLRHLYKNKHDEPFVGTFIISQEEIHETTFNDDGDEIHKYYIKQYTETVAIMLKTPMCAIDFDTKINIPLDAVACVVILPQCSKIEALKFKCLVAFSNFWIWFRMFFIKFVDTSMYCNAMDLMHDITNVRKQLNKIDIDNKQINKETQSGDLRAYYESQKELLINVPKPNDQELQYYESLQNYYKDKQQRKKRKREKKQKKRQEKKNKKKLLVNNNNNISTAAAATATSAPTKSIEANNITNTQESYFERRRFSKLIHEKDTLQKQLSYITSKLLFTSEKESKQDKNKYDNLKPECDNLLQMAIEIQSSTLNYLDSLSFISLFGAVILSHTQELSILCFFITLFAHATILYSMVPISFLIYGLLLLPRASQQFWLWIAAYTQIVMVLKFLYQLDIFCVGQYTDNNSQDTSYYYNIQPSWYCNNLNQGQIRFDQILGITKSEHSNDAVSILIADIVCLIFVAIHIMMLKKKGVWYETEHHYDNYIESWFKEYEKRHESYLQLEKEPAQNNKYDYDKIINGDEKNIQIIKRIGEPKRVYDCINDKFIENDQNYKDYDINKHRVEYVGLPVWDIYMFKFHSLIQNHLPKKIRMYFFELIPPSFRLLANSESICDEIKPGIDLYFWMFIIDIILLFWVLLFYSSMAEPKSVAAVTGSFSTSRFSGDMVYILFIQMMFMIFDRIVYLTNTLVLKLVCQFISVILFHYYIFVKWILNRNTFFYDNGFLVTYYLLRLIYWFLSCKQIAYGYPTFIRSHSRMSKRFTFFYYCFFTAYMAIPFVYEMRTILEWVCIPTTLQLFELMKVEDIYGQLFKVKCNITVYKQQRNRGEQIPMIKKFFQGGCVFIAIIAFLIVPLLLFSTSSPASTNNPVKDSQVTISINNIKGFGNLELLSLSNYRLEQSQVPLLLRPYFDATSQISQSIIFESDADSIFTVPTVLRDRVSEILGCLNSTNGQPLSPQACEQQLHDTHIELQYQFTRSGPDDNNPIKGIVYLSNQFYLTPPQGKQLSQVLNATNQNITSFLCPTPYAQWLRLPAQNDVSVYNSDINPLFNVTVTLITHEYESYWNIYPTLNFILISDNYVSSSLLSLTGVSSYSVVGFYAIVVYSFAQLLRLLYGDQVKEIIFQDLQNVDYILRIVTAVKLARNQRNYHLEELLYRKLIRIYRDPALIVTLTKRQDNTNSTTVDDISPHKSEKQSGLRNRKHKSNNNIVDDE